MGATTSSGTFPPIERTLVFMVSSAVSISSCPVQNTRISPGGCVTWICSTVTTAASRKSASGCLVYKMSTGYLRPGMRKMGAKSKYSLNFSASRVAEEIKSLISGRNRAISFTSPNKMSVCNVRSCASSTIITAYDARSGSPRNSLRSMPSVMYFSLVFSDVQSSNRMLYPTSFPSFTPASSATRAETDIAATRRGCVHPIFWPSFANPASHMYCGICVVFPDPVSPTITTTWWSSTARIRSSRYG